MYLSSLCWPHFCWAMMKMATLVPSAAEGACLQVWQGHPVAVEGEECAASSENVVLCQVQVTVVQEAIVASSYLESPHRVPETFHDQAHVPRVALESDEAMIPGALVVDLDSAPTSHHVVSVHFANVAWASQDDAKVPEEDEGACARESCADFLDLDLHDDGGGDGEEVEPHVLEVLAATGGLSTVGVHPCLTMADVLTGRYVPCVPHPILHHHPHYHSHHDPSLSHETPPDSHVHCYYFFPALCLGPGPGPSHAPYHLSGTCPPNPCLCPFQPLCLYFDLCLYFCPDNCLCPCLVPYHDPCLYPVGHGLCPFPCHVLSPFHALDP